MQQTAEINITGRGTVTSFPDGIQIDLSAISENVDYTECLSVLNVRVKNIIDGVARAGTEESVFTKSYAIDLLPINRTSHFSKKSINPENDGHENKQIQ